MTTNHRPTLESRRGRQLEQTSIVHARALPAHKQLKYRNDRVDEVEAKEKLVELKKELLLREKEHYKGGTETREASDEETFAQKRRRIQAESENLDESDEDAQDSQDSDGSDNGSDDESGDESDSSDDDEALLLELQKIKREKAEQQKKLEEEQRKEVALKSNPLLNQSGAKKSWRQATVFRNTSSTSTSKEKDNDNYVNDALRSDFHRRFLDRYIK